MKVKVLGDGCQLCHVLFVASGMGTNEIRDNLLTKVFLFIYTIEDTHELAELLERGLTHKGEHTVGGMLGSHFKPTAHMARDELARVAAGSLIAFLVLAVMEEQVVAHAGTNEALLYLGQRIHGMIDIEQSTVVGIEVLTNLRIDARGPFAMLAGFLVASAHAIHVCRRTAKIAQIALEARHSHHFLHLPKDALLTSASDELTLMGGDGTEGTTAETTAMDVHGEFYHLIGRYRLPPVLRMGHACIRQIEGGIELFGGERGIGRVHHGIYIVHRLKQSPGVHLVGFLLYITEVLCLRLLVVQAFLM